MTSNTPEPEAPTTVVGTVSGTAATTRIAPPAPSGDAPAPSGGATVSATTGEITLTRRDHDKVVLIHPGVRVQVELTDAPWDQWTAPESSNSSVLQRLSVSQPSGATIATFVGVQAGQAMITAVSRVPWGGSGPRPRAPNIGFIVTVTVQSS
jgi:hypothetical protein